MTGRGWPVVALAVVVLIVALAVATTVFAPTVSGGHYETASYEPGGNNDMTVHSYGADQREARRPGATDRSFWTETILYVAPRDETVYLETSVTYRPVRTDCGPNDIDELGIDRGNTYEGERRTDEDLTGKVKSYSEDEDARDRYGERFGEYDLSTADVDYIERLEVNWHGPDEFGPSVEIDHGDRFVSAQSSCFANPDAAGWYRWLGWGSATYENGTTVGRHEETLSHWYWICECADREEAVATLGPPPSAQDAETPTANESTDSDVGDTDDAVDRNTEQGDEPAGSQPTPTVVDREPTPDSTESADDRTWRDYQVRTPVAADGAGPGGVVWFLVVASLAVVCTRLRTRR